MFRMKKLNKKLGKVAVGVSGGVDSSVAVALLVEQGYDVIGVFMKFWAEKVQGQIRENICCSLESAEDARRVCQKLGIPFYVLDMKVPFKEKIVDDFIDKYNQGKTPNPCVLCNKYIKFEELWKKLKPMGVDYIATGHYAEIKKNKLTKKYLLQIGKDKEKDQTYFLHQVTQKQLQHTLFPLAKLNKTQVRKLARKYGLLTAEKKESQEICFVPTGKVEDFLKRYIQLQTGPIVEIGTTQDRAIGVHKGLPLYTIGQRKGIGLPGGPWFVVKLDPKNNILWVSKNEDDILHKEIIVKNINWISGEKPKFPFKCKCKIRYRSELAVAVVSELSGGKYKVEFKKLERASTPGQFAVFYKQSECLGGGEIV